MLQLQKVRPWYRGFAPLQKWRWVGRAIIAVKQTPLPALTRLFARCAIGQQGFHIGQQPCTVRFQLIQSTSFHQRLQLPPRERTGRHAGQHIPHAGKRLATTRLHQLLHRIFPHPFQGRQGITQPRPFHRKHHLRGIHTRPRQRQLQFLQLGLILHQFIRIATVIGQHRCHKLTRVARLQIGSLIGN